jgi:hypothetical protein
MNEQEGKPKSLRRWRQFSLRAILLVILLVALGMLILREYLKPYWRQQATMALVERLGGNCQTAEAGVRWLRVFGALHNVSAVNLAACDAPDAYVSDLAELPAIELLIVGGPAFGDEHARRLHRLRTLRCLILDSTSVSDDGIAALREVLDTTEVHASQRRAIAALQPLGVLQRLPNAAPARLRGLVGDEWFEEATTFESRFLASPLFCDHDMDYVKGLSRLVNLHLVGARLTDAGLEKIERLGQLKLLNLCGTHVTDAGLKNLKSLPQLRELWLDDTDVTDAGLEHLRTARQLRVLGLDDTHVTPAGVAKLKQALPQCIIQKRFWPSATP